MFASEVNLFIKGLYLQWTRNRSESKVVVEMKKRFGDLTTDMAVRTVIAGKRYSAAPIVALHEASEDCTVTGFHISAGTRLFVNLRKLQRDPCIWSGPQEFQPERFIEKHIDVEMWGRILN
ncbi:hypothetical protein ACET3Z_001227 [Daucus carota]